jgi:hypothetical protein
VAGTEEDAMAHDGTWEISISLDEHDGRTRAEARLHTRGGTHLRGVGYADRHPKDPEVPRIGEELAVSRALSELAHDLLLATADDIAASLHHPVSLRR